MTPSQCRSRQMVRASRRPDRARAMGAGIAVPRLADAARVTRPVDRWTDRARPVAAGLSRRHLAVRAEKVDRRHANARSAPPAPPAPRSRSAGSGERTYSHTGSGDLRGTDELVSPRFVARGRLQAEETMGPRPDYFGRPVPAARRAVEEKSDLNLPIHARSWLPARESAAGATNSTQRIRIGSESDEVAEKLDALTAASSSPPGTASTPERRRGCPR